MAARRYPWLLLALLIATLPACGTDGPEPAADGGPAASCLDLACGHGTCDDTAGEPTCLCEAGYATDEATGSCVDIDECATQDHGCDLRCENTDGSHQCALPRTCVDIRTMLPGSPDGDYQLFVHGDSDKPWTAYCHDMAGAPREFLPLIELGPDKNFGESHTGGAWSGSDVRTKYTRLRLHPEDLTVDTTSRTFADSNGRIVGVYGTQVGLVIEATNYATAQGCNGQDNGSANIDLRGTEFFVASQLCQSGWQPLGTAIFSDDRQIVDITGGGNCGWTMPAPCDDPLHSLLVLDYLGAP